VSGAHKHASRATDPLDLRWSRERHGALRAMANAGAVEVRVDVFQAGTVWSLACVGAMDVRDGHALLTASGRVLLATWDHERGKQMTGWDGRGGASW
jgi:hypothetical protein